MNDTRITELRRERGWTQERLAEASGVAVRTIQRLESGSDASLETLSMIAKALQVPVRELFGTVDHADFGAAVSGLDARTRTQQDRRDTITRGWRSLYVAVGVLVTFAMVALVSTTVVPGAAFLVVPAYWAGGQLVSRFLIDAVLNPRLDVAYPLSTASGRGDERNRSR